MRGGKRLGVPARCRAVASSAKHPGAWHAASPGPPVVHTVRSVLIPGGRWGALPGGPPCASKSAAHRWWQRWPAAGTLAAMLARGLAEGRGRLPWPAGAGEGAGSPWQGGR
jgi:hypothetical protein